jgi:hypothetical protein
MLCIDDSSTIVLFNSSSLSALASSSALGAVHTFIIHIFQALLILQRIGRQWLGLWGLPKRRGGTCPSSYRTGEQARARAPSSEGGQEGGQ